MKKRKAFLSLGVLFTSLCVSAGIMLYAINQANDIKYGERVTARYYDFNGNMIKSLKIRGGFAKPPDDLETEKNKIFMGWDKDILNISSDTDINPIGEDISSDKNVIYANTRYISKGKMLNISIMLGGIIECSDINLTIKYNPNMLRFNSFKEKYGFINVSNNEKEAILEVTVNNSENLNSNLELVGLQFAPIAESYSYTELDMNVENIKKLDYGGERVNTDCSVYDGKIYIY